MESPTVKSNWHGCDSVRRVAPSPPGGFAVW
jgi:hypothetical protein